MKHVLIMGRRRQGKSTLALRLAVTHSQLIVVWDPNSQYREWPAQSLAMIEASIAAQAYSTEETEGLVVLRFVPHPANFESSLQALLDLLWLWEDYTLIIDEASTVQNFAKMHSALDRLIRQGPASVQIIQCSHRPGDFHGTARALCTDLFFFHSDQTNDLKKISEYWDESLARVIQRLDIYQCAHYWLAAGGVKKITVWADPKVWFVEIGHGEKLSHGPTGDPTMMMTGLAPLTDDPILGDIDNA